MNSPDGFAIDRTLNISIGAVEPHCLHAVHSCGLLLKLLRVSWSVCFLVMTKSSAKQLNHIPNNISTSLLGLLAKIEVNVVGMWNRGAGGTMH